MADGKKSRKDLEEELEDMRLAGNDSGGFNSGEEKDELREDQADLIRKDRLALLGQLAASIGHEVLNPLGVVKNSAYYLRMITSPDDEKVLKHINIIEREVERARKIVTDLLNLTRTAPGDREEADLARLMDEAVHLAGVPPDMEIVRSYQVNVPKVTCDPQQMVQVFVNLITNAVQCLAGEESPRIKLSVYTQGQSVRAAVEDNGPGIPEEHLDKIFEPLFSSKTWGFGLGLTVCNQLVAVNGGEIKAENRHEKGARFVVSFPAGTEGEKG